MNKELIKKRFAKSLKTYEDQADVQQKIARKLASKAVRYLPASCNRLLEIGCGTGFLTRGLLSQVTVDQLYLNDLVDLSDRIDQLAGSHRSSARLTFLAGDAEKIVFPEKLEAVLSASTLQWLADLPGFFTKVHRALLPDGLFVFNTFGPQNLLEIKELMGAGLHYPSAETLSRMLETSFEILEIADETVVCDFNSPREVLRHLQETGVTATYSNFRWSKRNLFAFEKAYSEQFGKGSKVTLTWQVYYFVCQKKNVESHQAAI